MFMSMMRWRQTQGGHVQSQVMRHRGGRIYGTQLGCLAYVQGCVCVCVCARISACYETKLQRVMGNPYKALTADSDTRSFSSSKVFTHFFLSSK